MGMSKDKNTQRKNIIWIVLLVLAVVSAGTYTFYRHSVTTELAAQATQALDTAEVKQGRIIVSASGVGTIIPEREITVSFSVPGTVDYINVEEGDMVEEGQVLAALVEIEDYEVELYDAQQALAEAEADLQDLYDNLAYDRAEAAYAVSEAQVALEDAVQTLSQMTYSGRCTKEIADEYYFAYREQEEYVKKMKRWDWPTGDMISEAQMEADRLYITYTWCNTPYTETEMGLAEAEVALAEATLAETQAALDKLANGPDEQAVAMAERNIAVAESELKIAEENLEGATVVAPISGAVMDITAEPGDELEAGSLAFMTLADLDPPLVEVDLDEIDLSLAVVGYRVEVTFDALPDETFTGHIIQVEPSLTTEGSIGVVRTVVQLDEGSYDETQNFPMGMTASIEVIGSENENAVLVPVEAVHEISEDEYAVYVVEDGKKELREIEVGIIDFVYVEVLNGLEEGEVVYTGDIETQ